jgi:hypothetical protein
MTLFQKLAGYKAFRCLAYVFGFVLWLAPTMRDIRAAVAREWRANWTDFVLKVESVELSWARRKLAIRIEPEFAKHRPLPETAGNTIKFRRYTPYQSQDRVNVRWTAETIADAAKDPA